MRSLLRTAHTITLTGLVLATLAAGPTDDIDWPQQQVATSAAVPGSNPVIDWP